MGETAFRVYFGTRSATAEELRSIEDITVQQQLDGISEARLRVSMCLDENGRWKHPVRELAAPLARIRIEVKTGDKPFTPLIEGPVAGFDTALDARPGRSHATVTIRDDAVFLNREDRSERYDNRTDREIINAILGRHTDVLDGSPSIGTLNGDAARNAFQRDSDLVFLRKLARTYNMYAWVSPTAQKGKSKAHFEGIPRTASTDHPPLILMGSGRNLVQATINEDSESPERTRTATLRVSDGQIVPFESTYEDAQLMRSVPATPENVSAIRDMPPPDNDREDPSARGRAQTERRSYSVKLTAHLLTCYPAILQPYIKVQVDAADTPYSGPWAIWKVTHRITPSVYIQEFEARTNSLSRTGAAAPGLPNIF